MNANSPGGRRNRTEETALLGVGHSGVLGEAVVVGYLLIMGQPAVGSQQSCGADRHL